MNHALLIEYLINPRKTLLIWHSQTPILNSWISAFLFILMTTMYIAPSTASGFFAAIFLSVPLILFLLFFQSIFIDFVSQIFGFKAQSFHLFHWLGVSLFPLTLLVPIHLIFSGVALSTIFNLILIFFVIYLQIQTISVLYTMSFGASTMIYFLIPITCFFLFFLSTIVITILAFSFNIR